MDQQTHQHLALTTKQRRDVNLRSQIQGWGADLDPAVRPGVPRDKAPLIGVETLYPQIEPQIPTFKIHLSTEHMQMPPVFGTSCPPKGLSGALRTFAYQHSEGQKTKHFMLLMLADRIDMIESLVADLFRGKAPNLIHEMGLKAEWKHDKKSIIKKAAVIGMGLIAVTWLYRRMNRDES